MISRYGNDRSRAALWFDNTSKYGKTVELSLSLIE